ncbi:hypothetical protein [Derxia gummosa]|uniref:Uncharacterized protein n=1 Tax=Derxia gummosa DSM 723 TaxID=1121388 RepID=A0A8B6X4L2_9BURK|nr:hypothetical protein [Derxia gummosa]
MSEIPPDQPLQPERRPVTTAAGETFDVPEFILRIDEPGRAGWQLRYGEWTDYPDAGPGGADARRALDKAIAEMQFRIETRGK